LYVALSRVINSRNVKVILPPDQEYTRTTNVVYLEVLADEVSGLLTGVASPILTPISDRKHPE